MQIDKKFRKEHPESKARTTKASNCSHDWHMFDTYKYFNSDTEFVGYTVAYCPKCRAHRSVSYSKNVKIKD